MAQHPLQPKDRFSAGFRSSAHRQIFAESPGFNARHFSDRSVADWSRKPSLFVRFARIVNGQFGQLRGLSAKYCSTGT
jgi:hypothetical protein